MQAAAAAADEATERGTGPGGSPAMRRMPRTGVLAIAMAGCCSFLGLYATQPILPLLEALFRVSKAEAGLTVSVATGGVALLAPLSGALADRLGRRPLIVLSAFALALPTVLAATASTFRELLVWRFLQGALVPGSYAVAIAYITEEAGGSGVGSVMAALVTGSVIGGFLGRMVAGVVADHAGWRAAFVVLGATTAAGGAAIWRWLPPSRHFTPRRKRPPALRGQGSRWRALLERPLVATYAIGFNVLFSLVATFTYIPFRLGAPPFGLGPAALSGIFVVYLVGAVITPVAGRWVDRVGGRAVLTVALLAGAAGMALTLAPSLPLVIVGLVLCCTAAFIGQVTAASELRLAAAASIRSLASGVYLTCYYVGGTVGGVLPGFVWTRGGWPACVALVMAAQALTVAMALRFWVRRPAAHAAGR